MVGSIIYLNCCTGPCDPLLVKGVQAVAEVSTNVRIDVRSRLHPVQPCMEEQEYLINGKDEDILYKNVKSLLL